jgi:hypothetical protein
VLLAWIALGSDGPVFGLHLPGFAGLDGSVSVPVS